MMRIIAGSKKGRNIFSVPKDKNVKPVSARIKQSLFDMLRPRITGALFLDLYAGVGTVGLEALSRGALKAVFVEKAGLCVKTIEKNVAHLGFTPEQATVLKADVHSGLLWLKHHSDYRGYDIIFMGPPYRTDENLPQAYTAKTLQLVAEGDIAAPNALIVAQHHKKEPVAIPEALELVREVKYGDTLVKFLKVRAKP